MKRDRLNALLGLLNRLIGGENCMEFESFDMSNYFNVLTEFKNRHAGKIAERFGSVEQFDEIISDIKSREEQAGPSHCVSLADRVPVPALLNLEYLMADQIGAQHRGCHAGGSLLLISAPAAKLL